jgi:hypothetical protein
MKKTSRNKSARQLRAEREKRVMDAIHLKVPDRVPVICGMGFFPARYAGIPFSAAYYDYDAWYDAYRKTLLDFPADLIFPHSFMPGKALELLNPKQMRWPGFNSDPRHGHQAVEVDNMRADEYDAFINDPSDYMLRVHLPRVSDELAGLGQLPRLSGLTGPMGAQALSMALASPGVSRAIRTLQQTGRELNKWRKRIARFNRMMQDCGFPEYFQGAAMPPFDMISHSMRGMSGTMQDLFRQPNKVIKAAEKILQLTLERPMPRPSENGHIRVFMTNTRGADNFMSTRHFEKFYWPTFKTLVTTLIERGATPCIFFEGDFTSRLEYLLQLPRGKFLVRLDATDIFKAKEILRNHACIQGNVPSTLLQVGTVQQVMDYCKRLIDTIGEGGGFIISPRSSTDEVKPENLKMMITFTQGYGVYR